MFSYLGGLHFGCPSTTSGGGRHSLPKMQHPDHPLINLITESKEEVYIDDGEDTVDEFMLSLNIGDYSVDEDNVAGEWLCFLDHWLSEASSHTVSYLSTN